MKTVLEDDNLEELSKQNERHTSFNKKCKVRQGILHGAGIDNVNKLN